MQLTLVNANPTLTPSPGGTTPEPIQYLMQCKYNAVVGTIVGTTAPLDTVAGTTASLATVAGTTASLILAQLLAQLHHLLLF